VFIGNRNTVLDRIERAPEDTLRFRTVGLAKPGDLDLRPFNLLHFSRYAVYWKLFSDAEWEREKTRREELGRQESELNRTTIDRLDIGDPHSERSHRLKRRDTIVGNAPCPTFRAWRQMADGGCFTADLRVVPDASLAVHCEYGAVKDGAWPLEILVDGQALGKQTATMQGGISQVVTFAIPSELLRGKTSVTLTFRVPVGTPVGGVFDCRIVRV
jgi:hypothetical protein